MELMTAWQNSKCLPNLKITHANDTGCLVIFSTVSRIPKNIRINTLNKFIIKPCLPFHNFKQKLLLHHAYDCKLTGKKVAAQCQTY